MSSSHDITLTPQEQALIMRLKSLRVPEITYPGRTVERSQCRSEHFYGTHDSNG